MSPKSRTNFKNAAKATLLERGLDSARRRDERLKTNRCTSIKYKLMLKLILNKKLHLRLILKKINQYQ